MATLTINPATAEDAASNYNCVVTNAYGTDTSNNAALTVNAPVVITAQPVDTAGCSGSTLQLSVTATGSMPRTYQWRRGTVPLSSSGDFHGVTTPTLRVYPAARAIRRPNYNCVVTNACGSVTSDYVALTVNAPLTITRQPRGCRACTGQSASFSVTATGIPAPTYQWRKGFVNLVNGGHLSGVTSATLVIDPVDFSDEGLNYDCVVTNTCGVRDEQHHVFGD